MKVSEIDWHISPNTMTEKDELEKLIEKWRDRARNRNSVGAEWYALGALECAQDLEEILEE